MSQKIQVARPPQSVSLVDAFQSFPGTFDLKQVNPPSSMLKKWIKKLSNRHSSSVTDKKHLEKINTFLASISDLTLGYSDILFSSAKKLADDQIGYRVDPDGNSLLTGEEGGWKAEWVVIASDETGDPILVDTSIPELPVLHANHGMGEWVPVAIADSLEAFHFVISLLQNASLERDSPVALEKNAIGEAELQRLLGEIQEQNPQAGVWYWRIFLEQNDEDD